MSFQTSSISMIGFDSQHRDVCTLIDAHDTLRRLVKLVAAPTAPRWGRFPWARLSEIKLSNKGKQPAKQKAGAVGAIEHPKPRHSRASFSSVSIREFSQIIQRLVETFGWPGTLLVFVAWFIQVNATPDQKRRMIEMFVLGTNLPLPLVILSILFILVLWAQNFRYRRKLAIQEKRFEEVASVKSRLQEQKAGKPLRHGDDFKPEED